MKKVILGTLYLLISLTILAQNNSAKLDSLEKLVKNDRFKSPKEKLNAMNILTTEYLKSDLIKAESLAKMQITTAQLNKNKDFEMEAYENLGQLFYYRGNNDSALFFYRKAHNYYKSNHNQKHFHVLNNIGNVFKNIGKFDSAIIIYNEVLKYYEDTKNKELEAKSLANIGSLYYTAGNSVKAKDYMLKAIKIQRTLTDKSGLGVSLVNLMVFALNASNFKEGIKYGEESLPVLKAVNKSYYASALIRVGYCYYMEKKTQIAIKYTLEAIKINEENKNIVGMMESYRTLADYYVEQKQYLKAKEIGLKALNIADTTNRFELRHIYDLLKRVSIYSNNPEDAIKYSSLQIKVIEEFLNKDWAEKISDADTKYQTEKKTKEIKILNSEKKNQKTIIYSLAITFILTVSLMYFVFRNIRSKKIIAEQNLKLKEEQIVQLRKDRQLIAAHSALKGEEAERTRLARDLHDGLGGLLSGVKLSLSNLKGIYTMTSENVNKFDNTLNLLDSSIKEMRRISHNMMPEALIKFGLKDSLLDFCNKVNATNCKVIFSYYGNNNRLEQIMETSIYRIAQELVNNALKHANASEIMVQLMQDNNRLHLTVQDNGTGFDPQKVDIQKSTGLQNLKARAESFNGTLEISSKQGEGSEISVEFNIKS